MCLEYKENCIMTVTRAGEIWNYSKSETERLNKMLSEMPERFPRVAGHITIPDDSPKIFVPDYRSRNNKGYAYRYILNAIGTNCLIYPETIGINDAILRAYLEELLEHNEIRRVDPQSESWNTTDFIVRRNRLWVRKTSEEQRKYVAKLVKDFHPIDIL